MAHLKTAKRLPANAQEAMREFDDRFLMVQLSEDIEDDWVSQIGDVFSVDVQETVFPLSMVTAKYSEFMGENRFRKMKSSDFRLSVEEYDDGVEAPLLLLLKNVFSYQRWLDAPQLWKIAERKHIRLELAKRLEAGTSTEKGLDGQLFFSANHPANMVNGTGGVFSNYNSTPTDPTDTEALSEEMTAMRRVPDEFGDKAGVEPTAILLPTGQFQRTVNVLEQEIIANASGNAGIRNPLYGKLTPIHVPELTDDDDFYLVDQTLIARFGIPPWAVAMWEGPPELALREWGPDSEFCKDTGNVKKSSHIWDALALLFPQAIRRVAGATS